MIRHTIHLIRRTTATVIPAVAAILAAAVHQARGRSIQNALRGILKLCRSIRFCAFQRTSVCAPVSCGRSIQNALRVRYNFGGLFGMKKAISVIGLFLSATFLFAAKIPALTSPVMDTAGVVDAKTEAELNKYLMAVSEQTGVQVAVLTVPNLGGESIEEYSMAVAEKWQLGQKKEDNGVLLTVAMAEHALRIEVGYGLEGLLTDTKCGLIIRNGITPQFKDGDYTQGIVNGVLQIVRVATNGAEIATDLQTDEDEGSDLADGFVVAWFIFIVLMMITTRAGLGPLGLYWWLSLLTGTPFVRRYPKTTHHSGSFHGSFGGGSFHSGFGGGGFHGGGGGFGGGGASGKW
ncbi:MAG: TPM domain-containing protein [Treponema sp.]|nr:TPM domain-containing protein [Treponema sp.]